MGGNQKYHSKEINLYDPVVMGELEESARQAREFSDKFVKARILSPEWVDQPMTI